MTTRLEIAYATGLIDGEGCIRIKKDRGYECQGRKTPGYHALLAVRMVAPEAVGFLASHFGGKVHRERRPHSPNGRPLYHWSVSDRAAEKALRLLVPLLLVKRGQAETVLELRRLQKDGTKHRTKVVGYRDFPNQHGAVRRVPNLAFSDEYVAACEALYQRCKKLNRVGLAALAD